MTYISKYLCDQCNKELNPKKKDDIFQMHEFFGNMHFCKECFTEVKIHLLEFVAPDGRHNNPCIQPTKK